MPLKAEHSVILLCRYSCIIFTLIIPTHLRGRISQQLDWIPQGVHVIYDYIITALCKLSWHHFVIQTLEPFGEMMERKGYIKQP